MRKGGVMIRRSVVLCACFCIVSSLFAQNADSKAVSSTNSNNDNSVNKLELAGGDSFEYDINNKIRKAKSSVQVGVGINFTNNANTNKLQVNASVALGYSYFFSKNFGVRAQGIFDNTQTSYFGGVGADVMWDFIQTEPFGVGVFLGSSLGYEEQYHKNSEYKGFLAQLHVGVGMIFDGGRSRLDGVARIPYNKIGISKYPEITYILMYSYTF